MTAKLFEVYGRKEGWSREEFLAYQSGKHVEIVNRYLEIGPDGLMGGTQNSMILPEDLAAVKGVYVHENAAGKDTVAELQCADAEAVHRVFTAPDYVKYVRPDEKNFSDTRHNYSMVCHENLLAGEEMVPQYRKCLVFFTALDGDYSEWDEKKHSLADLACTKYGAVKVAENVKSDKQYQLDNEGIYERCFECWFDSDEQLESVIADKAFVTQIKGISDVDSSSVIILFVIDNLARMISEH